MAATTITRATITDDSGSGTDGTIINSAFFGTAIYDKVDRLFDTSNPVQFEKSASGTSYAVVIKNTHATGVARLALATTTSDLHTILDSFGPSWAGGGIAEAADVSRLAGQTSGGLAICASDAGGTIRFHAGGMTTPSLVVLPEGHLYFEESDTNPGAGFFVNDDSMSLYRKADKIVFAYKRGGNMTFVTLDLDGSDTTWSHGTSAP